MKNCTCSREDGIHEWDCAIEVEKRNIAHGRTYGDFTAENYCDCGLGLLSDGTCPMHFQNISSRPTQYGADSSICPSCGHMDGYHPIWCMAGE